MSVRFLILEQVNQEFLLEIDKTIKEVFAGGQFVLGQKLEAFENKIAARPQSKSSRELV